MRKYSKSLQYGKRIDLWGLVNERILHLRPRVNGFHTPATCMKVQMLLIVQRVLELNVKNVFTNKPFSSCQHYNMHIEQV